MNNHKPISFGNALGVLEVVEKSVTALGVPGLEAAVGGTLKVLQMIETMQNNKKDLVDLCDKLAALKMEFDRASSSSLGGELALRLSRASIQFASIIVDCNALQKSHRATRLLQGTRIAAQIVDIKQSVRDVIQNFVFFGSISIENIVGDMAPRLGKFIVSVHINNLVRAPARYDADDTPSECMRGTRVDLINDLMDHVANPFPSSRITIVYGIPGSGKSTIAKTVAIQLAQRGLLAASFFFSRNHSTRRELKLVFSTVAFQLAQFNKDYGRLLSDILENDPDLVHEGAKSHLDKLIIHPLSQLPPPTDGKLWIIALDALDECGSDHGGSLLHLLTSRLAQFPDNVRFFLTGRPENPILSAFNITTIKPITYKHTLDITPQGVISDDIRLYVTQSLGSEWPGKEEWKAKDNDVDVLVTRARGLFIFAATAVKYIQSRAARYHPQKSMESIIYGVDASNLNPRLLDQLYFTVVDDVVPTEDTTFLANYQRVLGAVVYLQEPLSTVAIAELLGMELDDVSRIVKLLNSVLLVSEETVRIAHLSFREFITDPDPKGPRTDLFLRGPINQSDLAISSIKLMNEKLHRNMCGLDTPDTYALNSDVPNLAELTAQNIPPALRYACFYWASHFRAADIVDPGELETWLGANVLLWLEVLSLWGELSRAFPLVAAAQSWYHHNTARTDFIRYTTLLSNINRFITEFFHTISLSAGHIYYSALPFTPSSSELWRTYSNLVGRSARIVTGVDSTWSPLQWTVNIGNSVYVVAFSPNGECIAYTCLHAIGIRSSETGQLLFTFEGHTESVNAIAFSQNGTRIISGSSDQTIRIWSLETGQSLSTLEGHTAGICSVSFSPDETRIVSGSADNTIRIWSSETGQSLSTLREHTDPVSVVAFSPDGTRIVSGSRDNTIRIWSLETGQSLLILKGHTLWVTAVAFSPDGTRIVSGSLDRTIRIWTSETGRPLSTIRGHVASSVALSQNGTRIISGSYDQTIRIWSSETGRSLSTLKGHTAGVLAVAFSRDQTRIVSGSYDQTIRVWSSEIVQPLSTPKGHTGMVNAVAISRDGTRIASSEDRIIRIWSSETAQLLSTLKGHTHCVLAVTFSRDGTHIVSGSRDHTIRLWASETGQLLFTLTGHAGWVLSVAFSQDETRIVSGSSDKKIRIWSSETGQSLFTLKGHTKEVNDVAYFRGGARIISGSYDQTIRIWSSETGQLLLTFGGHISPVLAVAFSRDENYIVTGSLDEVIRIWSPETGQLFLLLRGHPSTVKAVALSLDSCAMRILCTLALNSSTPTLDHSVVEPTRPTSQPWGPIRFDTKSGWIMLSSGLKPVCILPAAYASSIKTSDQFGSVLVLGLKNGRILILDISLISPT